MFDEKDIKDILREKRRGSALPWEEITDEFISAKEFASLLGISSGRQYRRLMVYLSIIYEGNNTGNIPPQIKDCFRGKVVVHLYRGRGPVNYEYRIAVRDLNVKCALLAQQSVACRRRADVGNLRAATLKKLKILSVHYKSDIMGVIDTLVDKEIAAVLSIQKSTNEGRPGVSPTGHN